MKQSAMNPYLPLWEYVPDGEPRVFGDRLYIYGSHDFAGGEKGFCPGDYMGWSAPLSDPGSWTCHGVIFRRSQDPALSPADAMAAPDVVQGPDGRYYLYYNSNAQWRCVVAVSDRPEGPFDYYGCVQNADGTPFEEFKMFDPGVLADDDGRIYLYVGFCMPGPVPERFKGMASPFKETSIGFELAPDMKTILHGPVPVLPGGNVTAGTGFEGHGFYEASSPRKISGTYVMVYSSEKSHDLAYALADAPLGPYTYAGVLVSNADLGLDGNQTAVMPYGNTHGGLAKLGEDWYVFYHRQTHGIECCRQGCAEKLPRRADGWFGQAEITSCGLNNGPLPAAGSYNACYCCHLTSPQIKPERLTIRECRRSGEPHIFEEPAGEDEAQSLHYIANIGSGTVVGYKYFDFDAPQGVEITLRGSGRVQVEVRLDAPDAPAQCENEIDLEEGRGWQSIVLGLPEITGVHALYFSFQVQQPVQFECFSFIPASCGEQADETCK